MRRLTANRAVPLVGALLLILLIVGGLLVVRQRDAYAFNGGEYAPPQPVAAPELTDQNGQPFSLADQKGAVQVLAFGYTTCPDVCPTTMLDFSAVKDELGADADGVRFLLITVDPERDTAARLKDYLAFFDPTFIGLRGDAAQTEAAERAFGVVARREEQPGSSTGYLMSHTARTFVIDREGLLRLSFPYGADPALIAADVRHLLNEG